VRATVRSGYLAVLAGGSPHRLTRASSTLGGNALPRTRRGGRCTSSTTAAVTFSLLAVLLVSCGPATEPAPARVGPSTSGAVLFGVHHQQDQDSVPALAERLGRTPAVVGVFVRFPFDDAAFAILDENAAEVLGSGAAILLTLEPHDGLEAIDADALESLTSWLSRWNERGLPVLVRFAHEMNGSWYPWSQRPARYVHAFREVAEAVRAAPASSTMWAPNEGTGYPFPGRSYGPEPGSEDHEALDTDGDGELTQDDDPYAPYWPGAEHVDWVGLSIYHFGDEPPWEANTVPEPGKFVDRVRGSYDGIEGDATAVPDFHGTYAEAEGLPFAIAETSALFVLERADEGAPDAEVKSAWAAQLFDAAVPEALPALELVMWFEDVKPEEAVPEVTSSWAFSDQPEVLDAVRSTWPDWLEFADALPVEPAD
jgi:hypothetical protein